MNLADSTIRPVAQRSLPGIVTVGDWMSYPVITVDLAASSREIERVLETYAISSVPVLGKDGFLAGIVSSTDLLASPLGSVQIASEIMMSPVLVARPDEELDAAAWRMFAARMHRVVVTDRDDRIHGVLSARDILDEVMRRPLEEPIGTLMRAPVECINIGDTIDEALERLAATGVHGLVVVDGLAPVGVFTHTEAMASRRLAPALRSRPVEEVMSAETLCLNVATPIRRAAAYMRVSNARRILVVQRRYLVGILSPIDLVGVFARDRRAHFDT